MGFVTFRGLSFAAWIVITDVCLGWCGPEGDGVVMVTQSCCLSSAFLPPLGSADLLLSSGSLSFLLQLHQLHHQEIKNTSSIMN